MSIGDLALDISFKSLDEVLEHSGAARQSDVAVESPAGIDGASLNRLVDDFGKGGGELLGENLGGEEDLRAKETLVANINCEVFLRSVEHALVLAEALRLLIIFLKLFHKVGANVAVLLLNAFGNRKSIIRR